MSPRRRRATGSIVLLGLLLAVMLPASVSAAPVPEVSLTGTLELLLAEDDVASTSSAQYVLHTERETIPLRFAGDAPDGFDNGATVRVRGQRAGGTLVALDGAAGGEVLASAPGWSGPRRIAVVLINFTNNASKPFSRAYADGIVFRNANSDRAYFAEQSHGAIVLTGTTFDWIRLPLANSSCQFDAWATAAKAVLAARGVDLTSFTNFMFMFPQSNACHWRGLGHVPGPSTWINGVPTLRTTAHELGHNFGVHHASTLRCTSNGSRVALSRSCTRSEYGDPFTTMGASGKRHDTNLELLQMGYLPASAARTVTVNGTYTLTHASAASGTRIISIPRGDGTWFYLEYRRPYGSQFDTFSRTSPAVNGVAIRIARSSSTITQSLLIDTVPSTTSFADAPLRLGRSFKDFLSGVRLTVTALGSSTAKIAISFPTDTVAPGAAASFSATATSSSSITLAWAPATDNRAVAGYRIWRDSSLLTTTTAGATRFLDTALSAGSRHVYSIRAVDAAGNLGVAVTTSAATLPGDAPPSAPGSLEADAQATVIQARWAAATDDVLVLAYRVWLDDAYLGATPNLAYTFAGLSPMTTYVVTLRAVDTAGQVGPAVTISVTTAAPEADPAG